jgi:hypothetical protein
VHKISILCLYLGKFFSMTFKAFYYLTNSSIYTLVALRAIYDYLSQSIYSLILNLHKSGMKDFNLLIISYGDGINLYLIFAKSNLKSPRSAIYGISFSNNSD